jgi:PTS system nitrogen regulatory IIA component
MAEEQLMSVEEMAQYLNVNISTVYMWSQKGQMPAMKVGKMWRYRRSDIDAWLDANRTPRIEPEAAGDGARPSGTTR